MPPETSTGMPEDLSGSIHSANFSSQMMQLGSAFFSSDKTSYELAGLLFASGLPGYPAEG